MTIKYVWQDAYKTAILETDWTKILDRLRAAESEIYKQQHVLSMDHGGTPEERQAIAAALDGMKILRNEVDEWQTRHFADGGAARAREDYSV